MKFTIITVNYNNANGLKRTLESVVGQTDKDFEWIVVDGGSSDASRNLLEKYDSEISFWCSEPDKGIYNAMNKGVAKANGDYCLFLNSGDILCDSHVIERLSNIPFTADIVSCDIYIDKISWKGLHKSVNYVNAFWIYENTLFHQSTWIKREVLVRCPYRENYERISDWAFFFEAIVIHNCSYLHVPVPISVFFRDGISSTPMQMGNTDRTHFLSSFFPEKYISDMRVDKVYRLSVDTLDMTKFGQKLMMLTCKIFSIIDYKLFRVVERLIMK